MHGTKNVGDCTRITYVFDVPHSKKNPWYRGGKDEKSAWQQHYK
jgi:hypothetical protein